MATKGTATLARTETSWPNTSGTMENTMTKANSTEIVFVLDRSGSMETIAADMKGGFDSFIQEQKKVPGECRVSLVSFNTTLDVVYEGLMLAAVPKLELYPRGGTALFDAVGVAITSTGARLANMPEAERPAKVLFVIITDGEENSSREYTKNQVAELVAHQQKKYSWDFIFLGANLDAAKAASDLNIAVGNVVQWDHTCRGSSDLMGCLNKQVSTYRNGGSDSKAIMGQADYAAAGKKH